MHRDDEHRLHELLHRLCRWDVKKSTSVFSKNSPSVFEEMRSYSAAPGNVRARCFTSDCAILLEFKEIQSACREMSSKTQQHVPGCLQCIQMSSGQIHSSTHTLGIYLQSSAPCVSEWTLQSKAFRWQTPAGFCGATHVLVVLYLWCLHDCYKHNGCSVSSVWIHFLCKSLKHHIWPQAFVCVHIHPTQTGTEALIVLLS